MGGPWGSGGIIAFLEHAFQGQTAARLIGWHNSPFQYEVAIANLVPGILGLLCLRYRERFFWLATVMVECIWFLGDAVGHVYQWHWKGDTAQGNIGGPFWGDILIPVILILLYRSWRKATASGATTGNG